MLKKILIVLAVLIAGILIAACFQPNTFHVERSVAIAAPPDKVLPHINDFHNWGAWDPWAKLDPSMKVTYSGAASGKGAVYEWQGNNQVGKAAWKSSTPPPRRFPSNWTSSSPCRPGMRPPSP